MANDYSAGGSRRAAVLVAILGLHVGFYYLLVSGLARDAVQLVTGPQFIDIPEPPPPPDDLEAPPPPPPIDRPPPVVPPPLIDLPSFPTSATAITQVTRQQPAAPAPVAPPRPVQVTPPSIRARGDRIAAAINSCYPSASRRLNEEGRVVVTVTIGADGRAGALSVAQSSGFDRLDGAAECVVRKLPFNPGKRDGTPVEAQATLPITFKLE